MVYIDGCLVPKKRGGLRTVVWCGDALDELRRFPETVQSHFGYDLHLVQVGNVPRNYRPMPSVGHGVYELRDQDGQGWYRLMYFTKIEDRIFVLDCFRKKTRKTSKKDLRTSEVRLKAVKKAIRERTL